MAFNKISLVAFLIFFSSLSIHAQGKYFEIVKVKKNRNTRLLATVKPLKNKKEIIINYNGKSKTQLIETVRQYLKNNPALIINEDLNNIIEYNKFDSICTKQKCLADLVGLTTVRCDFSDNGKIKISLAESTKIYTSIFGAVMKRGAGNNIVSDHDVPFNEFQFVLPKNEIIGSTITKNEWKAAYPESIFDADGKLINLNNKKIIEKFYDKYIDDLKIYLDKNLN